MTKPTTAPPATSALVPLGETGVTYNLDNYPIAGVGGRTTYVVAGRSFATPRAALDFASR